MSKIIAIIIFFFLFSLPLGAQLKSADLIFQLETPSDFSQAISAATSSQDSIKIIHVGIIEVNDSATFVIEASPEAGVREISLEEFILGSKTSEKNNLIVKRLSIDFPVEETLKKAKSFIGQPYDWYYLPDNGRMYCSELVEQSYKDLNGCPVFPTVAMNFKDSEGNFPQFWIDLFSQLKMEVPQGVPGTNPQDIFNHPDLREITRF